MNWLDKYTTQTMIYFVKSYNNSIQYQQKREIKTMTNESNITNNAPSVVINGQYIKDYSFESPNAPVSLAQQSTQPKVEVNLNLEAAAMPENVYEIVLQITVKASNEERVLFVTELSYAGLFTLTNIPEDQKELVILIHCPTILFPFARRILADGTRDGGFQPLMLDPIDFAALYQQRKEDGLKTNTATKN